MKPEALIDSLKYVTGKDYTLDDVQQMGDRIAALRAAFNLRDGFRSIDLPVPGRMIGSPPLEGGPLKGVTVDIDTQIRDYLEAMGWDTKTGVPNKETLDSLGLSFVAADLHSAGA
jgi:aldehyde:ferredoxin oxidoreductase